jgi:hypothetical protein
MIYEESKIGIEFHREVLVLFSRPLFLFLNKNITKKNKEYDVSFLFSSFNVD